jgi:hypothetical protein
MAGSFHLPDADLVELVLGACGHAGALVARSPIGPALEEVVAVAATAEIH